MKSFRLWIYSRLTPWLPESRGYAIKNALLRWAGAKIGKNGEEDVLIHFLLFFSGLFLVW